MSTMSGRRCHPATRRPVAALRASHCRQPSPTACSPLGVRGAWAWPSAGSRRAPADVRRVADGSWWARPPALHAPYRHGWLLPAAQSRNCGLDVTDLLQRAAETLAGNVIDEQGIAITAKARAKVLGGRSASWTMAWGVNGQFVQRTSIPDLSWSTGAAGTDSSKDHHCWHIDFMGHCSDLELEDREVELISGWVLGGVWPHAAAKGRLEITAETDGHSSRGAASLQLMIPGGRVAARLDVSRSTLLPESLWITSAAGTELWEYDKWKAWDGGTWLPGKVKHRPAAGGENSFKLYAAERQSSAATADLLRDGDGGTSDPFTCLTEPSRLPDCVTFEHEAPSKVRAVRGEGGHILLQASVNGQELGYFVLDTGSSALVIDQAAARDLGLKAIGQQHSTGIGESIEAFLRRADSLQIGPVAIHRPLFSAMALDGALRPPSDGSPVVGVVGYDFLRSCVVKVESRRREPGGTQPARLDVDVFQPGAFSPRPALGLAWQGLQFVSKVPLIKTGLCVETVVEEAAPRLDGTCDDSSVLASRDTGLFKLCLGVGGTGCVLGYEAATKLHIFQRLLGLQPRGILSGAGSQQARLQPVEEVATVRLTWVELQGMRFESVRAVVHTGGDPQDLELGKYAAGQLAGDLFRGDCTMVIDYPGKRFAVAPPDSSS